jgi:virulence-associated protein VagC
MSNIIVIEKIKKEFKNFQFLVEAISYDPFKKDFHVVHVEEDEDNKILTATDGRRMHQLIVKSDEIKEIEIGDYTVYKESSVILLVKEQSVKFPDWRKVIPKNTIKLYNQLVIDKTDMERTIYLFNRLGIGIAHKYLKALNGFTWNCCQNSAGTRGVLLFESGNRKAVIIPQDYSPYDKGILEIERELNRLVNEPAHNSIDRTENTHEMTVKEPNITDNKHLTA